jgi:hypothetical protein
VPFDKCYHQLCDDLTNINNQGLSEHSDAAVHAILTFAETQSAINGTGKGASKKAKEFKGHHRCANGAPRLDTRLRASCPAATRGGPIVSHQMRG